MDSQSKSDRVVRDFRPRHGLGATRGSIGVEGGHVRREHESLTCGDSTGEGVAAAGGLGGGAGWGRGVVGHLGSRTGTFHYNQTITYIHFKCKIVRTTRLYLNNFK